MARSAAEREQLEYEGFGPGDPESGRAQGKPRPRPAAGTSKDPAVGPPTRSDELALRRQARQREAGQRRQIEAEEPPARASARRSGPGSSRRGLGLGAPVTSSGFDAGDAGGFLLVALFLWPIGVNLLRGGPAQAKAWLAAKFTNKVAGSASSPAPPTYPPGAVTVPGPAQSPLPQIPGYNTGPGSQYPNGLGGQAIR